MKSNGSMNHIYFVLWNVAKSIWQAICEAGNAHDEEIIRTAGVTCLGSRRQEPDGQY